MEDEQIDHLLTVASKTLPDNLCNAKSALKNKDYQLLGLTAHSMKGSLLNLGLNDLAEEAKKIEINATKDIKINFQVPLSILCEKLTDLLDKD